MLFDIGDRVWVASWEKDKRWETCPHCLGKKYLTIIMGDESRVSIDCVCCTDQWRSSGQIAVYDYIPKTAEIIIEGYEVSKERGGGRKIHYSSGCHGYDNVFGTQEEAQGYALAKIEQQKEEDDRRLNCIKDQSEKTWASATHHLERIKEFEKQIEYHKTKLAVAELHIKAK
jgi:hypothetical protein